MIYVNIENLEMLISKLSKAIDEYESTFFSINHEYDIIKENYQSEKMQAFYSNLDERQIETKKVIALLKDYLKVLRLIYDRYKEIGNEITIDLDNKEILLENLNTTEESFNKVLNSLNLANFKERIVLAEEKEKLKEEQNKFLKTKKQIINFYDEIENIETDIKATSKK